METLIRVEPAKHMYRWYAVGIQNTLVDGIAVVIGWGSLKSSFQQWRTHQVQNLEEANTMKDHILLERLKKGYVRRG
jgi:predicted DNA-binding WGR domain protein